ncbi:MAG: hypothetical protein H0T73_09130 [Ardenticatenales bacterium]|nr:hypothetical protein [Ardenticatenales bacterium]
MAMESWVQLLHTLSYTWVEPVYQCLIAYDIEIIKQDGQYWYLIRCRADGATQRHGPFSSVEEAIENSLKVMEALFRTWESGLEAA